MGVGTAWACLVVAGLLEVAWATTMKHSEGFRLLWPSVATVVFMLLSFALLSQAMRVLPLGTAYAAWTGIGAVGSVLVGMLFLGEPRDAARLLSVAFILLGIVGLRLSQPS